MVQAWSELTAAEQQEFKRWMVEKSDQADRVAELAAAEAAKPKLYVHMTAAEKAVFHRRNHIPTRSGVR